MQTFNLNISKCVHKIVNISCSKIPTLLSQCYLKELFYIFRIRFVSQVMVRIFQSNNFLKATIHHATSRAIDCSNRQREPIRTPILSTRHLIGSRQQLRGVSCGFQLSRSGRTEKQQQSGGPIHGLLKTLGLFKKI